MLGDEERERLVDIVDTEFDELDEDLESFLDPFISSLASALRLRPRSSSFLARTSSATPFLNSISLIAGLPFKAIPTCAIDRWECRWSISVQASGLLTAGSSKALKCKAFLGPVPCTHSCSAVLDSQTRQAGPEQTNSSFLRHFWQSVSAVALEDAAKFGPRKRFIELV